MILLSLKERAGTLAFALAAVFASLTTLVPASCGAACTGCPVAGGCLVIPAVAAGIGAFSVRSRIRAVLGRIAG